MRGGDQRADPVLLSVSGRGNGKTMSSWISPRKSDFANEERMLLGPARPVAQSLPPSGPSLLRPTREPPGWRQSNSMPTRIQTPFRRGRRPAGRGLRWAGACDPRGNGRGRCGRPRHQIRRGRRRKVAFARRCRARPARRAAGRFTIEASGDLLIHTAVWERALALGGGDYDFAPLFKEIKPYVAGADLALCHVETPMTPAPPTSYPIFNTPPALAQGIKATGWDGCDTASNHSLDQTQTGIDATGQALDHAGVEHTGSFPSAAAQRKPVIIRVHRVKIAFLAYTTDTNGIPAPPVVGEHPPARDASSPTLAGRGMGADAVIVNLHWGGEIVPEYQSQPSPGQLALAKKLITSPLITAIVGQGPHAVQPIERIDDKFVVFSEGNLISNQSPEAGLPASSQDGLIALLDCVARGGHVRCATSATYRCSSTTPTSRCFRSGMRSRRARGTRGCCGPPTSAPCRSSAAASTSSRCRPSCRRRDSRRRERHSRWLFLRGDEPLELVEAVRPAVPVKRATRLGLERALRQGDLRRLTEIAK